MLEVSNSQKQQSNELIDISRSKSCTLDLSVEIERQTVYWKKIECIWGVITLQNVSICPIHRTIQKNIECYQNEENNHLGDGSDTQHNKKQKCLSNTEFPNNESGCLHCSAYAKNIRIRFIAKKNARITAIATPYEITENQLVKDYFIDIDEIKSGKMKNIIFRLSLNNMQCEIPNHDIFVVEVTYINNHFKKEYLTIGKSIIRPNIIIAENIPIHLDNQLNRYLATIALSNAVDLAQKSEHILSRCEIIDNINSIQKSISGQTSYCKILINELKKCKKLLENTQTIATGTEYTIKLTDILLYEKWM